MTEPKVRYPWGDALDGDDPTGPIVRPGVPLLEWPAFADPYVDRNGLTISFLVGVADLCVLGKQFGNALMGARAERVGREILAGKLQVFRAMRGDVPESCGNLIVREGQLRMDWDRAHMRDRMSPSHMRDAIEDFVEAVNEGRIATHWRIGRRGFLKPRSRKATFGLPASRAS